MSKCFKYHHISVVLDISLFSQWCSSVSYWCFGTTSRSLTLEDGVDKVSQNSRN